MSSQIIKGYPQKPQEPESNKYQQSPKTDPDRVLQDLKVGLTQGWEAGIGVNLSL